MSDFIEPASNVADKWFGSFIRRRLHGTELRDGLLLKEAGTLVVSMRSLYSTFNQLMGELLLLDEEWSAEKREEVLKKITDFSYRWKTMPMVVGSLKALKEKEANKERGINERDREAVGSLIECGKKFLNDAGLNEEGRQDHFGPTPWGNSEIFQRLLEDTKEARTDDMVRQVKMAVEGALQIFERDNIIKADEALNILKNNILTRYPTIPYPEF